MVKASLLCQFLLVACCISLVVVSAMPHKKAKSKKNEDSDESCEGNSCSSKESRHRDSSSEKKQATTKKPSSEVGRTRRPSSINAAPLNLQGTGITSIKTPGLVSQADPSTGTACTTCAGVNPVVGSAAAIVGTTGTTIETGGALADPTTGAACTTCTGADRAAGPATGTAVGTTGTKTPIRKPSLGEAGRIRNPGSANLADPSTGAACTTCAGVGSAGTTAIRKPSLGEAGRNGNPVPSVNQGDPSTGAACTTCTPANPATGTAGTNSAAGTTGTTAIRKPSSGEAGRVRNPGSANLADPSTGAVCTTCTGVDKAVSSATETAPGSTPIKKPSLGEAGRNGNPVSSVNQADPSTGVACTTCTGAKPATGTAGTTGTIPTRSKPSLAETGGIRNPGLVNITDQPGTACTTCAGADPVTRTTGTISASETIGTSPTTCTTCTTVDKATGTPVKESSGSTVTTPVNKPISLIDPARIKRPGPLSTGSSTNPGPVGTMTCVTCTLNKTTSLGETNLAKTPAPSDLVKKEADPSLIGAKVEAVSDTTLSRFNTTVVKTVDHIHFNYDDPNKWKEHNSLCKGAHQSPINIETRKTIVSTLPDISFFNYEKSYPENLENNGHTVQLSIDKLILDLPFITGGGLDGLYQFAQMHFHWGEGLYGSEHTIDGKQYVAEAHIVHWDMKYGNFINATKHSDGLHVLGILIELQARDNIAFRHLEQFDKLTKASRPKTDQLSYSVPLSDLLPDSTSSFYRYAGSLTDARCNEDVIWTVFDTPIAISERQLAKFRLLTDEHGKLLTKNVRPTQLSHKRTVVYNPPSSP